MFDDYSSAALRNMIYLLHGLGSTTAPALKKYEQSLFFSKVRQYSDQITLPKIQTVIFNRAAGEELNRAEEAIKQEQCQIILDLMNKIEESSELKIQDVFNLARKPSDAKAVDKMCCFMRDMYSPGILSMRYGLPFWTIKRNSKGLQERMGGKSPSVRQEAVDATLEQLMGKPSSAMIGGRSVLHALTSGHQPLGAISSEMVRAVKEEAEQSASACWGNPSKKPRLSA
jgi:hypothetical protein